jgi:gamma-glutamylcyclotransferase
MTARIFAYGSNMCSNRLRYYKVHPLNDGLAALLQGYRLVFNKLSTDGSGKANVEQSEDEDECMWGVIYEIPDNELCILDDGEVGYKRRNRSVVIYGEQRVDAWIYLAQSTDKSGKLKPYTWYTNLIVNGAIEHHLPDDYTKKLCNIIADIDPNPARDAAKRSLACGN